MDLKPGYQRTDVGVIPEGWSVQAVGDLVEAGAPICYGVVQVGQHTGAGVPIVAIKFVKEISTAPLHRTAPVLEKPYIRSRPTGGDVLISIKGTIGRVGIVPAGFQGNISRELARLRVNRDTCPEFIAHQLEAGATQDRIMRSVVGTTRLEFSIASLRQFQLPIPPTVTEQRAIAAALSDVDTLLAALDRLLAKKRDVKRAAMQQLLTGQSRLPSFTGKWEVQRLGSIGTFVKGSGIRKDEAASGDIPCVRYGEIYTRHHDVVRQFTSRISRSVAAQATRLKRGDILFAGSGETKEEIGKAVAFVDDCEAYAGGDIVILRPHSSDSTFLGYYLNTPPIQVQKASRGQGDAVVHIGAAALAAIEITMPVDTAEQSAIATVLSDMDAELAALEQRRDKTLALKQGMMQELLTGRTRLV
jgi:type I restriction enzyme S subunit